MSPVWPCLGHCGEVVHSRYGPAALILLARMHDDDYPSAGGPGNGTSAAHPRGRAEVLYPAITGMLVALVLLVVAASCLGHRIRADEEAT